MTKKLWYFLFYIFITYLPYTKTEEAHADPYKQPAIFITCARTIYREFIYKSLEHIRPDPGIIGNDSIANCVSTLITVGGYCVASSHNEKEERTRELFKINAIGITLYESLKTVARVLPSSTSGYIDYLTSTISRNIFFQYAKQFYYDSPLCMNIYENIGQTISTVLVHQIYRCIINKRAEKIGWDGISFSISFSYKGDI